MISKPSSVHFAYLLQASGVAALGGLLFGYDTAVIAGTVEYLQVHFGLSDLALGWTVSSALVGCIPGAALAGPMSDRFGRKVGLLICAVLFLASAIWSGLAGSAGELVWARILGGIGVGAASLITPVYITEIAPAHRRGALTTLNQMAILLGMVIVYLVNAQLAHAGTEVWRTTVSWRWMFASEAVPAIAFFLLLFTIPESPRWLVLRGREDEARKVLLRLGTERPMEEELQEIRQSFVGHEIPWRQILAPPLRGILVLGGALAIFQQLTGINIVMYYAPRIFTSAGVPTSTAIGHSVIIGVVMIIFTSVALFLSDRLGRRLLLLVSTAGMAICLAALGFVLRNDGGGHEGVVLFWILSYVAAFSIGMGPVMWTVIMEIFPNRVRGRAGGLCVLLLWSANFLVSQFFPYFLATMGAATFWLYGGITLGSFVFILSCVPETKGRSLEEIEQELTISSRGRTK